MNIYKKTLQIFAAISIIALASINLHAATVTITQDNLPSVSHPNIEGWKANSEFGNNYSLGDTWRGTATYIPGDKTIVMSNNLSRLECRTEMPIGTIYVLARINVTDEYTHHNALTVQLGKKKSSLS